MKRINSIAGIICAVAAGAAGLLAANALARPELIAFPHGYEKWMLYASVDRYDVKQYRELYTSPEAVRAVREGRPIPDGTVIAMAIYAARLDAAGAPQKDGKGRFIKDKLGAVTVMEKRRGWGAAIPEEWRNGDWHYASFNADGKPNEKANAGIKGCFVCHKPHERQDFVISLAQLAGKFPTAPVAAKTGVNDVTISGFAFGPATIRIAAGQPVRWTNADDSPHQITLVERGLRAPVLLKGQSTTLSFDEEGTIGYICGLHPNMKGAVEVTQ